MDHVGKKDYHYIRMHGQQNIKIKQRISEETDAILRAIFYVLLTVHFSIFILVINQLYAQNFVLQ